MLEKIIELLVALLVAGGAAGVGNAADHARPGGSDQAIAAINAVIARLQAADAPAAASNASDRAAQAHIDAAAAKAAGQAKATDAKTNHQQPAAAGKPADAGKPAAVPRWTHRGSIRRPARRSIRPGRPIPDHRVRPSTRLVSPRKDQAA